VSCASRPALAALLAALAAAGCTPPPTGAPRPTSVEPAWAEPTAATPVLIRGSSFVPSVTQDLGGAAGDRADAGFSAWLGGAALLDVRWVDAHTLSAIVPAGLSTGPKELVVQDAEGRRGSAAGAFTVGRPAALAAAVAVSRATASVGQVVTVTLTVENVGGAGAVQVTPTALSAAGEGALGPLTGPDPATAVSIPAGGSATFRWTGAAAARGAVTFSAGGAGEDAASGRPVAAAPATSAALLVQLPPSLEATLTLPPAFVPGPFEATLTLRNRGEATATLVTAAPLTVVAGSSAAASELVAFPGAVELAGGETVSLETDWTATAGLLTLEGSAAGQDVNTGLAVGTGPVRSATATVGVPPEVVLLEADALGDGSPFAFVNGWQGGLLLGPDASGRHVALRSAADVTERLDFALPRDASAIGKQSRNALAAAPPYPSLGSPACSAAALAACGPDLEDGRGLVAVQSWGGTPWLLAGGARTGGDLNYLHVTPDAASPLALRYVDLSLALASGVEALTAARGLDARLYLGLGGADAQLVELDTQPTAAGLDANPGVDTTDLGFGELPRLGRNGAPANPAAVVTVDVVEQFGGQLFLANNGGFARSASYPPRPYLTHPEDWTDATPSAAAWAARASVTVGSAANLAPRDRAVPAAVAWDGRLLAVRNTTAGPQLWTCSPSVGGDAAACDPGDWSLSAPNTSGDALLTQANDAGNLRAGLLVATGAWLYLGLENEAGVQLYRTATATPVNVSDFRGKGGCQAGSAGCEGLGGDGLGAPTFATHFLDAKALAPGGAAGLYFTVGNGVEPARLYFVPD